MVTPGWWWVELDAGTAMDRSLQKPPDWEPTVGDKVEAHGMTWRLVEVQPGPRYARAVLEGEEISGQPRPPTGRG